jgi:hypothetical protein
VAQDGDEWRAPVNKVFFLFILQRCQYLDYAASDGRMTDDYEFKIYCNGFDQRVARQQLCKHGTLRNNRGSCVFYVVRAKSLYYGKKPTIWTQTHPSDRVLPLNSIRTQLQTSLKLRNLNDNNGHLEFYRTDTTGEKSKPSTPLHHLRIFKKRVNIKQQSVWVHHQMIPFHALRNTLNLMSNLKQKLLHRTLHLKIHSRFLRSNKTHKLQQHQKTRLHGKERRNSPQLSLHQKSTASMFWKISNN